MFVYQQISYYQFEQSSSVKGKYSRIDIDVKLCKVKNSLHLPAPLKLRLNTCIFG